MPYRFYCTDLINTETPLISKRNTFPFDVRDISQALCATKYVNGNAGAVTMAESNVAPGVVLSHWQEILKR